MTRAARRINASRPGGAVGEIVVVEDGGGMAGVLGRHGLVQTPDYARAVIGADPRLSDEVVEQRVRFRMERQQTAADITVIMGEGALALVAGSPDVMTAQAEHLRSVSADVRELPFTAGPSPRRSAFALLDFSDIEDPPVVYVEGGGIARYLDKPDDWTDYEFVWRILMEKSISIREWPT